MISQQTIEEIKERASLVDIVGESVNLKRNGMNFTGLCPFHSEKSPSFHIRDSGRFYHCFGCGVSGNVITYVMESRGLSFPDAVEELAARYGIEVKREGGVQRPEEAPHKDALYAINKLASEFYLAQLKTADPAVGEYLKGRGITPASMSEFSIGFAPRQWGALCDFLKSKQFDEALLLQSGLVRRSPRGDLYDTFRSRIIFPIAIEGRKIAGFGGRLVPGLLEESALKSAPKYLNSPESPVYQKNKIFYGLPQALEAIRRSKELYLVEGYMDVIGLHQAGVRNVLATCGTAVSDNHVKRLQHLVQRVYLLFDGDLAGRAAAAKCFSVFLNSGIDVVALFLPDEEDPDTIALRHGVETESYLQTLEKSPLLDCYIESLLLKSGWKEMRDLGAAAKGRISEEVAQVLAKVRNNIEQSDLLQRAALRLLVEPKDLAALIREGGASSASATPKLIQPIPPQGLPQNAAIEDLPRVDRELLLAVMVDRQGLTATLLHDPDICEGVHPSTLRFIEGLDAILEESRTDEGAKREQAKALLKSFGESWILHWKKAHQMLRDDEVDFVRSVDECRRHLKKTKLKQAIMEIDLRLGQSERDADKEAWAREKVLLTRRLEQL